LKRKENGQEELSTVIGRPRELTKREKEVVSLIADGYKSREVAKQLAISVKTVETHRANIMNKLALRNLAQLIRYAIQKGIVSVEMKVIMTFYGLCNEMIPFI
jgi:DNA-binding NarL/FixJ family response regulator